MKKLLLCITVLSLVNMGHSAYGIEEEKKLNIQLFDAIAEFESPHESFLVQPDKDDTLKINALLAAGANPNAIDEESGMWHHYT